MGKRALVVSGGGSNGAFAVGALDYLVNKKNLEFDIFCGSSTGSLISSLMVTGDIDILKNIYSTVHTKDIIKLKIFGLCGNSIFSTSPLQKIIKRYINDERTEKIFSSQKQMFLTTVNLQTSETVYFQSGPKGVSSDYEIIPLQDKMMLQQALLASSNQPVLMPPVTIKTPNGRSDQYSDGGVREVAPLKIAIDNGAEEIYAVVLNPEKSSVSEKKLRKIPEIALKTLSMLEEEIVYNDIHMLDVYNSGLMLIDAFQKEFVDTGKIKKSEFNDILEKNSGLLKNKKIKKIHIIRPDEELSGGFQGLEFDPDKMKEMMEFGYNTTRKKIED